MRRTASIILHALACLLLTAYLASAQELPDSPPSILTLSEAIERAVSRHPDIMAADLDRRIAETRLQTSFGTFLPTISASGGYTRYLSSGTTIIEGTPLAGNRPDDFYRAGVSLNYLLFDGFGRTASYRATQLEHDATMLAIDATRRVIEIDVRRAFLDGLRTQQVVELRQVELATSRESHGRMLERIELGVALPGESYAGEADIAMNEVAILEVQSTFDDARARLLLLMNDDPTHTIQLSTEGVTVVPDSIVIADELKRLGSIDKMLERIVDQRFDLRAQRIRIDAARARVSAARAGYFPSIGTSVSWGWDKSGPVSSNDGTFNISLQYDLFDGFRTDEQVDIARAEVERAEREYDRFALNERSRIIAALTRLETAGRMVLAAERAVVAARQNRTAAQERMEIGVGTYDAFLTANTRFIDARVNQINSAYSYWSALFELRYLIGDENVGIR